MSQCFMCKHKWVVRGIKVGSFVRINLPSRQINSTLIFPLYGSLCIKVL